MTARYEVQRIDAPGHYSSLTGPASEKEAVARGSLVIRSHPGPDRFRMPGDHAWRPWKPRPFAAVRVGALTAKLHPGQAVRFETHSGARYRIRCLPEPRHVLLDPTRDIEALRAERIDQGVDFAGHGPFHPIGPARIIVWHPRNDPGWPGGSYVAYEFTEAAGPLLYDSTAKRGKVVYLAENLDLNAALGVGHLVDASTSLGTLIDAFPNCEHGFADPSGLRPLAQFYGGGDSNTALGASMNALLVELGAPPCSTEGFPQRGGVPPGWPASWRGVAA